MADDEFVTVEPRFHCFDDELPHEHPLAYEVLACKDCKTFVHVGNETMKAWFETGIGPVCLDCFYVRHKAPPTCPHPDQWDVLAFNG